MIVTVTRTFQNVANGHKTSISVDSHQEKLSYFPETCEECGELLLEDEHTGQVVCASCGLVHEELVLVDQERRWNSQQEWQNRTRMGGPIQVGEATEIDRHMRDFQGCPVPNKAFYLHLRKWHSRILRGTVRYAIQSRNEIERVCSVLDLPVPVHQAARYLLNRLRIHVNLQGYSTAGSVAAAIYVACLTTRGTSVLLPDLVMVAGTEKSETYQVVQLLCKTLGIKLPGSGDRAQKYVGEIGSKLHVASTVLQAARELAGRVRVPSGKDPRGIAAAILYLVCAREGDHRSQEAIGKIAGVTTVTMRGRAKEIQRQFLNLCSKNITNGRV